MGCERLPKIIASYIYDNVIKPKRTNDVKLKITVVRKNGTSKWIEYEGSAKEFVDGIDAIKKLEEQE